MSIRIYYFLDEAPKKFAERVREYVPRLGEIVRLKSRVFKVRIIVWDEDEPTHLQTVSIKLRELTHDE